MVDDACVPKRETIGQRLHRLRSARGMTQRELAVPGVSYAYISRVEADARTPSVRALRKIAEKLGVSVNYLETGTESPIERGVKDAGLDYASMTAAEHRIVQTAAEQASREGARRAAQNVLDKRRDAERARLKKRLAELG